MTSTICSDARETSHGAVDEWDPEIRVDKILSVRRELGEGRYYVAEKLDVVVDRLIEDLLPDSVCEHDSRRTLPTKAKHSAERRRSNKTLTQSTVRSRLPTNLRAAKGVRPS